MLMTKIAEFKLNKKNSFIFNMLSLIIFIIGLEITDFIPNKLGILTTSNNMFFSLSIPLIIVVAHEMMHAAAYKMFGAKLKFGVKHFSIFLADMSGNLFTLMQISIIMLFPLVFLSAILLIAASVFKHCLAFLLLGILINIAGSIGDILLLTYILFKGRTCRVKDEQNGFSLYKTNIQGSS